MIAAKFITGISALAAPIAGSSGLSVGRFLLFDGSSSLLVVLGAVLFSQQLERVPSELASLGRDALTL